MPFALLGPLSGLFGLVRIALLVAAFWAAFMIGWGRVKSHYEALGYKRGVAEAAAVINADGDAKVADARDAVNGLTPTPIEKIELEIICNADPACRDKGAK